MSDKFSFRSEKHDVSDVLSSIRKLVSDEAQAFRVNGDLGDDNETLVLTQADRVAGPPVRVARAETSIDRAELRQMVREIIEEELAGEFGDRMSRNLRKMARRAISNVIREGQAE